jgi:hypothetical protein
VPPCANLFSSTFHEGRSLRLAQSMLQRARFAEKHEAILSQNAALWQGYAVAYFGVIWPAAKYADDLTVINMGADIRGAPHAGITSPSLNNADLKARARDVAQFLGINNSDQLAARALQAAIDEGARDSLVLMFHCRSSRISSG